MSNPLIGHKSYWLRQVGDTGEGNIPAILQTLTSLGGGDSLALKCMDGTLFQGQIDPATPVHSVADVQAIARVCEASGVAFCPVVVPRGVAGEPEAHAALAVAIGALVCDIEPYSGLFDQAPLSAIPTYCQALRTNAPDAYLVLQPDPRPYAFGAIDVPGIASYFSAMAPQFYVGWDAVGWTDVAREVQRFNVLAALGRDMHVTLYGAGDSDLAGQFWAQVQDRTLGLQVFAFGAMNLAQLQAAATWAKPGGVVPVPPDDKDQQIAALQASVTDLSLKLGAANDARDRLSALLHQIAAEAGAA